MKRLALLFSGELRRVAGKVTEARLVVSKIVEANDSPERIPPDVVAELRHARTALDEALNELRGARPAEKLRLQGPQRAGKAPGWGKGRRADQRFRAG